MIKDWKNKWERSEEYWRWNRMKVRNERERIIETKREWDSERQLLRRSEGIQLNRGEWERIKVYLKKRNIRYDVLKIHIAPLYKTS